MKASRPRHWDSASLSIEAAIGVSKHARTNTRTHTHTYIHTLGGYALEADFKSHSQLDVNVDAQSLGEIKDKELKNTERTSAARAAARSWRIALAQIPAAQPGVASVRQRIARAKLDTERRRYGCKAQSITKGTNKRSS